MDSKANFLDATDPIPGLNNITVGDFWRWAYSDVLANTTRSVFAEFLVGLALGVLDRPRVEWDSVDLRYGENRIEVKCSAYCQSWAQSIPSKICFDIPRTRPWNPMTGQYGPERIRSADCYVFCVYPERDRAKCNVLDVTAWEFYIMPTALLEQAFKDRVRVSLRAIESRSVSCRFERLKQTVDEVLTGDRSAAHA